MTSKLERASIQRRWRSGWVVAAALLTGAWPTSSPAKTMRIISRANDLPVGTIARLCNRGLIALIETNPDGSSRQVVLFTRLAVKPDRIYDVLMDVEAYPRFLRTIDRISIVGRRRDMFAFQWTLDLPLMGLDGTRLQRGRRPVMVESRGQTGNLRGSRERWELYPVPGGTLVAFYRALDIETGGFLLRTLVDLEPSTEAGANLSSGFIHMRGLAQHLTSGPAPRPKPQARTGPVPPFVPLDLSREAPLAKLTPLLDHGLLAVIESHDDGSLRQVALLGAGKVPVAKIRAVVADATKYPEFMPNISRQRVTQRDDGQLQLDWTIKTPVSSMSGTALMTVGTESIEVNAVSGDVSRARIRWRFVPIAKDRAVTVYYSYSDIRSASWVTRLLLNAEPLLEHGMVAAAGTIALTAMTARAEGRR